MDIIPILQTTKPGLRGCVPCSLITRILNPELGLRCRPAHFKRCALVPTHPSWSKLLGEVAQRTWVEHTEDLFPQGLDKRVMETREAARHIRTTSGERK